MRLHHACTCQCLLLCAISKQQKLLLNEIWKISFCTLLKLFSIALTERKNNWLQEYEHLVVKASKAQTKGFDSLRDGYSATQSRRGWERWYGGTIWFTWLNHGHKSIALLEQQPISPKSSLFTSLSYSEPNNDLLDCLTQVLLSNNKKSFASRGKLLILLTIFLTGELSQDSVEERSVSSSFIP